MIFSGKRSVLLLRTATNSTKERVVYLLATGAERRSKTRTAHACKQSTKFIAKSGKICRAIEEGKARKEF